MKQINKYIEYEVKINSLPLEMFGMMAGGGEGSKDVTTTDSGYSIDVEDGYTEATEADIDLLAQFLGGGI